MAMSNIIQPDDPKTNVSENSEHELLAQRIREAREYLGLSQEFVAEHLQIPRASVSAMETGKRKVSSLELKQLSNLLKRPISYFLGDDKLEQEELLQDKTSRALFRAAKALSEKDREQVLLYAQFLRNAGRAPNRVNDSNEIEAS